MTALAELSFERIAAIARAHPAHNPACPRCKNPDNVVSDGAGDWYCEPCDHWWSEPRDEWDTYEGDDAYQRNKDEPR